MLRPKRSPVKQDFLQAEHGDCEGIHGRRIMKIEFLNLFSLMDLVGAAGFLNRASHGRLARPGFPDGELVGLAAANHSPTKSKTQGRSANPSSAQELKYQKVSGCSTPPYYAVCEKVPYKSRLRHSSTRRKKTSDSLT